MSDLFFGVNLGSKLAGTTMICVLKDRKIFFLDVDKDVDADEFILNAAAHFNPSLVFIDAPLSLPGKYCQLPGCADYLLRRADQEVHALSPMILGGITARAIRIKDQLTEKGIDVKETYTKLVALRLQLQLSGYKETALHLKACRDQLKGVLKSDICLDCAEVTSWHHLDALLALMAAMNYANGTAVSYGDQREGLIYV